MLYHLLSTLTKQRDDILTLNIGTKAGLPPRVVQIGTEAGAHVSIRVTEGQSEDRVTAEVGVSLPFLKGTCRAAFRTGELGRFASGIDNVQRTQAGLAQLTVVPECLVLNVLVDEKRQLICAVRHRRTPALAVYTISTFSVDPADLPTIIDGLQAADPVGK